MKLKTSSKSSTNSTINLAWEIKSTKPSWLKLSWIQTITLGIKLLPKKYLQQLPPDISLIFIPNNHSQKLNFIYRKKDYATDVLSFNLDQQGEVYICWPVALRQAREYGLDIKDEVQRLIIHGYLHLAGFDHEIGPKNAKLMFSWQDKICGWSSAPKSPSSLILADDKNKV